MDSEFLFFRKDSKEKRMKNIKDAIEKHLGREVELERDERGRWQIPRSLYETSDFKFDQ